MQTVFCWGCWLGEFERDGFSVRFCPKIDHFNESAVLSRLTSRACSAEDYRHAVGVGVHAEAVAVIRVDRAKNLVAATPLDFFKDFLTALDVLVHILGICVVCVLLAGCQLRVDELALLENLMLG